MLGEFTGEDKLDSGLNFSGGESVLLVVSHQLGGFQSESVERVADERVHDVHGFLGDSGFMVNLLQDFVDVDTKRFNSSFGSLLFNSLDLFGGGGGFSRRHFKLIPNISITIYNLLTWILNSDWTKFKNQDFDLTNN